MSGKIKIVRTDCELECPRIDQGLRDWGAELILLPEDISELELADVVSDVDLLLMCYTPITATVINRAKRLKGIVKYGVGIDAIDIEAARACAIPVVNIPEYAEETVAEGAFAMMIALAKKTIPIHNAMQKQAWVYPVSEWLGKDIAGKTVGIVGFGRIARSMARMAGAGFRANVIAYSPYTDEKAMQNHGVEKCHDLNDMLSRSDFVSIHCTLNPSSHHLIGESQLNSMKPTAYLINTSRGAIVDEYALLKALQEKRIAGAGLDVFSQEPLSQSDHFLSELYSMDNVILSPHLTFFTDNAMQRLEQETLERCMEILEGRPTRIKSRDPRLLVQSHNVYFE